MFCTSNLTAVVLLSVFLTMKLVCCHCFQNVDKFCYLDDMFSVDGRCDLTVTARVRSPWKKFGEYLSILNRKGFLLKLKAKDISNV